MELKRHLRNYKVSLFPLVGAIVLVSCSSSDFIGAARPDNDGTNGGVVGDASLKKPKWIEDLGRKHFRDLFDEAASGDSGKSSKNSETMNRPSGGSVLDERAQASTSLGDELLNGVDGVLWVPCGEHSSNTTEFKTEYSGNKGAKIRISGEFCPFRGDSKEINIIFVIDRSGSMEGHGNAFANDKTSGGSCGRMKAAKVLIEKYEALKDTKVRAGVVNFASKASLKVPFTDLGEMKKSLDDDTFCGFDPSNGALTNYQAAFSSTKKAISEVAGPKIVYFITDGDPSTADGTSIDFEEAAKEGLEAAENLRSLKDTYLFALFVGYRSDKKNPRDYLEKITGDASSVKVVGDADELVRAAASLGVAGPVKLSKDETSLVLKNMNQESRIGLEAFLPHPKKLGAYIWASDPIALIGETGKTTLNTITAKSKLPNGESLKTIVEIGFKQAN